MDNQFTYETDQFAISAKSIHLLRNRFNYKTIDFSKVQTLVIRKGMEHKNWILILSIGIALLAFVVIDTLEIYNRWYTAQVIYKPYKTMRKLVLLLLFIPLLMSGQSTAPENQIIVTGVAEKEIEPDWVELSMTARETENTRKESDVVLMEKTILNYLSSIGIDSSGFSIIRYSANTKYNSSSGSKFQMSKSYLLRVNDLKYLDKIIEKCLDAGMDNVQIKSAGHSQLDSFRSQMLQDALKNAQDKADLIAKTMGINLGKVIYVEENYSIPRVMNFESGFYANELSYETRQNRSGSSLGYQKIVLNKTVLVKFAIQ